MDDGLLPPFGEPPGPLTDDGTVLRGFIQGQPVGHSPRFHVEERLLVATPAMAAAVRISADTMLVRLDVAAGMEDAKQAVEQALTEEGFSLLDEETLLATPVAIQWLGLRASSWDLWGRDIDRAFAELRAAAAGELFEGLPPVLGD